MVAPVSGPYNRTIRYYGPITSLGYKPVHVEIVRKWRRQKPPYNLALAFSYSGKFVLQSMTSPTSYTSVGDLPYWWESTQTSVANKAYAKFASSARAGAEASLGATIGEGREAIAMIADRASRLFRFGLACKRLDWRAAGEALGVHPKDFLRRKRRAEDWRTTASKIYLEYHFGWAPLLSDIYAGLEVVDLPFPPVKVKARSSEWTRYRQPIGTDGFQTFSAKLSCEMGATILVDDPNRFRMNQLGLVNPASVAWELVPFSFVVDWFIPVGAYLSSMTDFVGLRLVNGYTTFHQRRTTVRQWPSANWFFTGLDVKVERSTGVTPPSLATFRYGISAGRAASAVSLLQMQLHGIARGRL